MAISSLSHDLGYLARDLYWESDLLQRIYSSGALAWGRIAEIAGSQEIALASYCNSARRIKRPDEKRRRLQEFAEFTSRHVTTKKPESLADNDFVRAFLRSKEAIRIADSLRSTPREERVRLNRNLIILKAPSTLERGVILIQYTPHFNTFIVNFDLRKVCERFSIVLEPSWYPYPSPFWAQFVCRGTLVACQTISDVVAADMERCGLSIVPVPIGAQDWVNPNVFFPIPGTKKEFDVVMIASFMRLKRHDVLFRAMQKMHPHRIKVALIGRTWGRNREQFDRQVRDSGVGEDVTIFQGLKGKEINEVLSRSKVNVLLSKIEGGNVALMEAMAAGVPSVVYENIIGPRLTDINEETGLLASDEELHHVLRKAIDEYARFRPREWFLRNTGHLNATRVLDSALRAASLQRGATYTEPIVAKENRLGLCYVNQEDERRMASGWRELELALARL